MYIHVYICIYMCAKEASPNCGTCQNIRMTIMESFEFQNKAIAIKRKEVASRQAPWVELTHANDTITYN